MLRKSVLVTMLVASSMFAFPAFAFTPEDPELPPPPPVPIDRTGSPPGIPEGGLNCAFISTDHTGNGYWECDVFMVIVSPENP